MSDEPVNAGWVDMTHQHCIRIWEKGAKEEIVAKQEAEWAKINAMRDDNRAAIAAAKLALESRRERQAGGPKITHIEGNPEPHFHVNTVGMLEACYHRLTPKNWATGLLLWTISFPFEHLLWERAPLFSALTKWLGL